LAKPQFPKDSQSRRRLRSQLFAGRTSYRCRRQDEADCDYRFSASQVTRTFDASEKYEWIDGRPVFQPSTGKILFVAAGPGVWNHFRLLDATDGTTTTLVEANDGFHGIFTPSFIGDDGVIFAGMGPQNPNLAQEVHAYLLHPITDWLAYEYRLGGKATTALPEIYAHSLRTNPNTSGVTNLLASRDGKTVVWIDLSSTDPNLKAKFNYEIFKLENGTITQMTNLRTHMAGLALSYDGSTVAFGSDPSRNKADADLFVLELATGAIHPMGLVERMRARPDCVNHDLGSEYTRNPKNAGA
jgi:hypothetical protein